MVFLMHFPTMNEWIWWTIFIKRRRISIGTEVANWTASQILPTIVVLAYSTLTFFLILLVYFENWMMLYKNIPGSTLKLACLSKGKNVQISRWQFQLSPGQHTLHLSFIPPHCFTALHQCDLWCGAWEHNPS